MYDSVTAPETQGKDNRFVSAFLCVSFCAGDKVLSFGYQPEREEKCTTLMKAEQESKSYV